MKDMSARLEYYPLDGALPDAPHFSWLSLELLPRPSLALSFMWAKKHVRTMEGSASRGERPACLQIL